MPEGVQQSRRRWALPSLLLSLSAYGWFALHDDHSAPGMAVLGGYRDRWFLICALGTYVGVICGAAALFRWRKKTLLRVALLQIGIAIPIFASEAAAAAGLVDFRTLIPGSARRRASGTSHMDSRLRRTSSPNTLSEGTTYPDLVSILGADAEPISFAYRTDRFGLRNPGERAGAPIICLGDSILVAALVPLEDGVVQRLERMLGKPVLNVSQVGDAPQEELIRLESVVPNPEGRLVVQFFFEGNDLHGSAAWRHWVEGGRATYPKSGLIKSALRALHRPKKTAGRQRSARYSTRDGHSRDIYFFFDSSVIDAELDEVTQLRRIFMGARSRIESVGGRYAIVFVPAKITVLHASCDWADSSPLADPRFARSQLRRLMGELCQEEGISYTDLTPALQAAAQAGDLPYFAADTHLNSTGHRVMAATLISWIEDLMPPH